MENHAPDRGATDIDLFLVKELVNVESNSWHVTQDEDGHNEEQDGGVGSVLVATLSGVDCNEHPDIEKYEEEHRHETKDKESEIQINYKTMLLIINDYLVQF